jgi:hypothetical protein
MDRTSATQSMWDVNRLDELIGELSKIRCEMLELENQFAHRPSTWLVRTMRAREICFITLRCAVGTFGLFRTSWLRAGYRPSDGLSLESWPTWTRS